MDLSGCTMLPELVERL